MDILLIDDCSATNALHTEIIKEFDDKLEIISVTSGLQAIPILKKTAGNSKIVFLDVIMPMCNGFELLDWAILNNLTENTTFFFLTSQMTEDVNFQYENFKHLAEIILKPLTIEKLEKNLIAHINRS